MRVNRIYRNWLAAVLAAVLSTTWVAQPAIAAPGAAAAAPASAPRLNADASVSRVFLEWSRVEGSREYHVFRATNGVFGTTPFARVQGRFFRDFRVQPGTSYSYRVAAVNRVGVGPLSNVATAMPLTPPRGVKAAPGDTKVTLTWLASTGATAYDVYRGRGFNWGSLEKVGSTATVEFIDTRVTNGTNYFYRVRATAGTESSNLSMPVHAKPQGPPTPAPTVAPTGVTATLTAGTVKLQWLPVATATGYKVFRSTDNATWTAPPLGQTRELLYLDRTPPSGTVFYRVAAYNTTGTGPMSDSASATSTPPPAAPQGLSAMPGNAMVTLSWTPVAGATSYRVYRGTATNAQNPAPVGTNVTTSAFVDSTVTNGTTYFYKITAVNAGGEGPRSSEANATPMAPVVVGTPIASAVAGNAMVSLTWGSVTGATSYRVYRGTTSGGEGTTPFATNLTTPNFTDSGLTNGLTYFYQVTAVAGALESARSTEVNATPTGTPATTSPKLETFRFLRQAGWGPKPGDVAALEPLGAAGRDAYITSQFGAPMSVYPDTLFNESIEVAQERFMQNALTGQDQLRQRVAWALHKIWVVSAVEVQDSSAIITYHRLFMNGAFGNFRTLMRAVTLNPAMGRYLNMLNNKSVAKTGFAANENYAREIMQLFTLGLVQLDQNGVPLPGPQPTYTEEDVKALARIFTGWTYGDGNPATIPGNSGGSTNWRVPMEAVAASANWHDVTAKTFLGQSFPANVDANTELDRALDVIFAQPTLAPFISRQLIQQLVTSNPSPAYVQAVSAVFNDNGGGVRGDLAAVVRAILMHAEALAAPDVNTTSGKLAEPVLYISSMMRAFNATVSDHPFSTDRSEVMGQRVFYPPSVFSYFSPGFRVRGTNNGAGGTLVGPEFQGLTTVTALERANFVGALLRGDFASNVTIDYAPFTTKAGNATTLVDFVAETFMGDASRMSSQQRTAIVNAVNVTPASNATERVRTALYLTLTAAQAQVDH